MLDQITKQRYEAAAAAASDAATSFNEAQGKVQEDRNNFFEKLALFNSGTIAASVTLATALHQHSPMRKFWLLELCWILLLLAMAFCLVRNWNSHSQLFYAAKARYFQKMAASKAAFAKHLRHSNANIVDTDGASEDPEEYQAELQSKTDELTLHFKNAEKKSETAYTRLLFFERAAMVETIIGILALLIFAALNLNP